MSQLRVPIAPRFVRYGLAGTYAAVILWVSVISVPDGTVPSQGPVAVFGADKWIHAVIYLLLTVLVAYAVLARSTRAVIAVTGICIVYGVGIELVQSTVPARQFELLDALANATGAVLAALCWRVLLSSRYISYPDV